MYDVYFGVAMETGFYAFDRRSAMHVSLRRTPPPIERSEFDVLRSLRVILMVKVLLVSIFFEGSDGASTGPIWNTRASRQQQGLVGKNPEDVKSSWSIQHRSGSNVDG